MRVPAAASRTLLLVPLLLGAAQESSSLRELRDDALGLLPESVHLSDKDLRKLDEGKVLRKDLDTDVRHETATFVMARIEVAPRFFERAYLQYGTQVETVEADLYGMIGPAAADADFHGLTLVDKDYRELPRCKLADCKSKLSIFWMRRFLEEVDWGSDTAEERVDALYREMLAALARGYWQRGTAALLRANDKDETIDIAKEVRATLDSAATLRRLYPELYDYLSAFPAGRLAGVEDRLYWMRDDVGANKPVVALVHRTVYRPNGRNLVVVAQVLYSNHFLESSLGFTIMVPAVGDDAVYLLHEHRLRLDTLRGGFFFRGRIRKGLRGLAERRVTLAKERLELAARQEE